MLGVSLFISCKNKIQCVCVKIKRMGDIADLLNTQTKTKRVRKSEEIKEYVSKTVQDKT